jgi:hypothetical protein
MKKIIKVSFEDDRIDLTQDIVLTRYERLRLFFTELVMRFLK